MRTAWRNRKTVWNIEVYKSIDLLHIFYIIDDVTITGLDETNYLILENSWSIRYLLLFRTKEIRPFTFPNNQKKLYES